MKNGIKILIVAVLLGLAAPSHAQFFGCYARGADTVADQLGMPWSICVNNVSVETGVFEAVVNVDGTNIRNRVVVRDAEVSGQDGSYLVKVPLFDTKAPGACADVLEASIILSFKMDKQGVIDQGSLALSVSSGEITGSCVHGQEMQKTEIPLVKTDK
jgi:hypothetical protein